MEADEGGATTDLANIVHIRLRNIDQGRPSGLETAPQQQLEPCARMPIGQVEPCRGE